MARHMKTTVVISDALLEEATKVAAAENTTLKALINEGLQDVLAKRRKAKKQFRLRDCSFGKGGLRPEVAHLSMNDIMALANDRD
jgi:hypothetical protein